MGFLSQAVKTSVKKIKGEYDQYRKRRRSRDSNESDGDHIYETLSLAPESRSNSYSHMGNKTINEDAQPNNSMDSGISEPAPPKEKPKKLQFAPNIERIHYERRSLPIRSKGGRHMVEGRYKVKYFEAPSAKSVQYTERRTVSNSLDYSDPIDLNTSQQIYETPIRHVSPFSQRTSSSDSYLAPTERKSPPKPPRSALCLRKINITLNRAEQPTAKSEVLLPTPDVTNGSSQKLEILEKIPVQPEPIYAQVTPRCSRNLDQTITMKSPSLDSKEESSLGTSQISLCKSGLSEDFYPKDASTLRNNILMKDVKESLKLIHKTNWTLNQNDILVEEMKCAEKSPMDRKFVVNMFESRPSKRWQKAMRESTKESHDDFRRQTFNRMSLDSKIIKPKTCEETEGTNELAEIASREIKMEIEKARYELDQMLLKDKNNSVVKEAVNNINNQNYGYLKLKKDRDLECLKMVQASKALEEIRTKKGKKDWLQVLVAETVLLKTSERINLLTQQISDIGYSTITERPLHKGTLRLSSIKFPFIQRLRGNNKTDKNLTEFFLMTVSHGSKMLASEFLTGEKEPLTFQREYTFKDIPPDFEIKVKLFCLRLRTSEECFWEKFISSGPWATSKIIYENCITRQYLEKEVFKPSFHLCAEATLTSAQINEQSTPLITHPAVFNKLEGTIEHEFKCAAVDTIVYLCGFLDVGMLLGETYFWERKWCVLKGSNLLLYNYPQDEYFASPVEQINLEYCFGPIVTKVNNCPKRRCFQLKTGRPTDVICNNLLKSLKSKPNFALRTFYFAAQNQQEYVRWTEEVEKLLDSLKFFKKLIFDKEMD